MTETSKRSNLVSRTITAVIVLTIVLVLMWIPRLYLGFYIGVSLLVSIGLYEYYAIVRAREISPETIGGILSGTAIALSGMFNSNGITSLCLFGGCLLVSALHIVRGQHSVAGLSSTVFGLFYVGWFGAHILLLHSEPVTGPGLVTILFTAVILTDSGAYFVGSLIGKHKLAPKVSPGKTWEGAVGGFLFAMLGMVVLYVLREKYQWAALPDWDAWRYAHAGLILSITGQIGDLAESVLKRDAGVKDSGNLFPGHGGVLDRCDAMLFAAPAFYYIVSPLH